MRVGISIASSYAAAPDTRVAARWMIERATAAAGAGLDYLFVGDHHVTPSPYYQNTPMLGRLLAQWDERPAGALYLLPLWHPVLLAEQIATLANIAQGPFIMQCALGSGRAVFNAMSANPGHRPSAFEQSLALMRQLWAGDTVSLDGRWKIKGAHISPLPPVPIEVWIGASARPAIDRAARLGDVWLAEPGATLSQLAEMMAHYKSCCARYGAIPRRIAVRRDVYVGATAEQAATVTRPYVEGGYRGFDPAALVSGSAEQVARHFAQLAQMGFSEVIVRNLVSDQQQALATIEALAPVREMVLGL